MAPTLLTGPEIAPKSGVVKQLVIFLHGLGSNGDDLISLAPMMDLRDTQFLSPNACFPFDMAPFGYQWFSLVDRDPVRMLEGAKTAAPYLNHYIDTQAARFKLDDSRIALVGFSQGSMMSLYTAPRRAKALAGVVGISGALIGGESLANERKSKPPICLIHGEWDDVVPFAAMGMAERSLQANGFAVEWHPRPHLGHGIDPEGIDFTTTFLKKCFKL